MDSQLNPLIHLCEAQLKKTFQSDGLLNETLDYSCLNPESAVLETRQNPTGPPPEAPVTFIFKGRAVRTRDERTAGGNHMHHVYSSLTNENKSL